MSKEEPSKKSKGAKPKNKPQVEAPLQEIGGEASGLTSIDSLKKFLAEKLHISDDKEEEPKVKVLDENTVDGVVKYINDKKCKNIITLAGAGISTSAGIPDFRSPGSGLYHNLEKYKLPHPHAIFELDFFHRNPKPFFVLARELYPGSFTPTISHYFIRLLSEKGILLRHYSQNIDTLERVAGIPGEKLVEAHGTFYTGHCLKCRKEYNLEWMKEIIFKDEIPTCKCGGIVKPDIVFFGETMPDKFYTLTESDFEKCDLLIVLGSSLVVQPFASLVDRVSETCPRLLINREKAGDRSGLMAMLGMGGGMDFDSKNNTRDVAWLGNCDEGCQLLAEKLGWGEELSKLREEAVKKLENSNTKEEEPKVKVLDENTVDGVVKYINDKKCKNIIILAGAGISTSAGIPDFRSPGSGLYHNLKKYKLPHPHAIFELDFFHRNPKPFFVLARELYPGSFTPTISHYFIRLLSEKGILLRHYSQNIDTLERVAGIPGEKLVEAHGTFYTGHCLKCRKEYNLEWMKEIIFKDEIPTCKCGGIVKPDIVFFGETLPDKFYTLTESDFEKCDLLIVLGSSLVVQPFASLVDRVSETCPRLLINREKAGDRSGLMAMLGMGGGMDFDSKNNTRDVAWLGNCDEGCQLLAEKLGWGEELSKLREEAVKKLENSNTKEDKKSKKADAKKQ